MEGTLNDKLLNKSTELSERLFTLTEELQKVVSNPDKVDLPRIQVLCREIDVVSSQIELINEILDPS